MRSHVVHRGVLRPGAGVHRVALDCAHPVKLLGPAVADCSADPVAHAWDPRPRERAHVCCLCPRSHAPTACLYSADTVLAKITAMRSKESKYLEGYGMGGIYHVDGATARAHGMVVIPRAARDLRVRGWRPLLSPPALRFRRRPEPPADGHVRRVQLLQRAVPRCAGVPRRPRRIMPRSPLSHAGAVVGVTHVRVCEQASSLPCASSRRRWCA